MNLKEQLLRDKPKMPVTETTEELEESGSEFWGIERVANRRLQLPIRAKSKIDRLSTITYPNPAGSLAAGAYFH